MKLKTLLSLTAALGVVASANAQVLLGGFNGESDTAIQSASISNITVTLARTGSSSDISQGFSQIGSTTWGTQALDTVPGDSNAPAAHAIFQSGTHLNEAPFTFQPITLVLTITNNGVNDIILDQMHWWIKKDINNVGPNLQSLTYSSGDLADADNTGTGDFTLANGTNAHDIDLSSILTDTTLSSGQSATFTWAHGVAQDPTGNTSLRMDNFAISGSVVPEASAAALIALAGLALLRRRR